MTVIALYNWPWHWCAEANERDTANIDARGLRKRKAITPSHSETDETTRLRRALLFAALATVLRPTNILIWLALTLLTFVRGVKTNKLVNIPGTRRSALIEFAGYTLLPTKAEVFALTREAMLCGGTVLALSAVADRLFYKSWTFPPWHFLYFNVAQSIAIFYGNNNWHYYLTQGYPLLLTTALPFAAVGMYRALFNGSAYRNLSQSARVTLCNLTLTSLVVPAILSVISHKEVRFIYPLLPALHVLAAHPIFTYFAPAFDNLRPYSYNSQVVKRFILGTLLGVNLLISLYTATLHNAGLITITSYLRTTFEDYYLPQPAASASNMTVGFLMPCHSTPWRSHLQYPPTAGLPGIDAWALTCEPPIDMNATAKAAYLDEADLFYTEPTAWLKRHMSRTPPTPNFATAGGHEPGVFASHTAKPRRVFEIETRDEEALWRERRGRRPWPEYLVFFQQLEPHLKTAVGRRSGYQECTRIWNSHWHDDHRRTGDVVVWCLYPERRGAGDTTRPVTPLVEERKDKTVLSAKEHGGRKSAVEKPFWKQHPLMGRKEEPESWWAWAEEKLGRGAGTRRKKKRPWWDGLLGGRAGHWD